MNTSQESLEAAIERVGGAVPLLRNSPIRPHTFPVTPEFTNWRTGRLMGHRIGPGSSPAH